MRCVFAILAGLALITGFGCRPEQKAAVEGQAILMTVGSKEFREDEFRRAYRVFRAAYGAGADETPAEERDALIRFIQQLADELVLMEHARACGGLMTEADLRQAVEGIRRDYPEGMFDQMLLENAVKFDDWKEALRVRLTIEKLIATELDDKIRITEADLAAHYEAHPGEMPAPPVEGVDDQVDQLLVQQLRRRKAEQAFGPWIADLRTRYPVSIDTAVVQRIMAERGLVADAGAEKPAE